MKKFNNLKKEKISNIEINNNLEKNNNNIKKIKEISK